MQALRYQKFHDVKKVIFQFVCPHDDVYSWMVLQQTDRLTLRAGRSDYSAGG
jgi:hypothetical protein